MIAVRPAAPDNVLHGPKQLSQEALLAVQRSGITSARRLLCMSELELVEALDLYVSDVRAVVAAATAVCAPPPSTAQQLMREAPLPTGLAALDGHLGGGLRPGSVTEIVGASAVGKTELCLAVAAEALVTGHARGAGVVYVDTECGFKATRLLQLVERSLQRRGVQTDPHELLYRVTVLAADEWEGYEQCLSRIRALFQDDTRLATGLLVVDSIAAPARAHFERARLSERQRLLSSHAALFKSLAEEEGLVVLVTNQVQGSSGSDDGGLRELSRVGEPEDEMSACLGTSWAHCVNVRLVLHSAEQPPAAVGATLAPPRRQLRVAKANFCSAASFDLDATLEGLVQAAG